MKFIFLFLVLLSTSLFASEGITFPDPVTTGSAGVTLAGSLFAVWKWVSKVSTKLDTVLEVLKTIEKIQNETKK
jgi:hypothetical protein